MKRLLLLIFSLILMTSAYGQSDSLEVIENNPDSNLIQKRFLQPSLTFDYGKAAISFMTDNQIFEGSLNLLFYEMFYLVGEMGAGMVEPFNAYQNGIYQAVGTYYRLGGGMLKNLDAKSKLGIGVRYAISNFDDKRTIWKTSDFQDDQTIIEERKNLTARWMEMVLTSESRLILNKENQSAKINDVFAIGFHLRLRFMSTYDKFQPIDVYSVPGFGKIVNNPVPAINLYLRVKI